MVKVTKLWLEEGSYGLRNEATVRRTKLWLDRLQGRRWGGDMVYLSPPTLKVGGT